MWKAFKLTAYSACTAFWWTRLVRCMKAVAGASLEHTQKHITTTLSVLLLWATLTVRTQSCPSAHTYPHMFKLVSVFICCVCVISLLSDESPSLQALSAVRALIQHGVAKGYLQTSLVILGHRDIADTQCPGEKLYSSLHILKAPINHTSWKFHWLKPMFWYSYDFDLLRCQCQFKNI